jgi:AbrB family looped-hinge helix DNA binding protein
MANKVGSKGQVVIEKEIRDQLGVQPGWLAVQSVVDGHVEIHFVPPEHNKSLMGSLSKYTSVHVGPDEDWQKVREFAWAEAARQKEDYPGRHS